MIVEYIISKECKNEEVWCTYYKYDKCERVFKNGFMVDKGGTTINDEDKE